MADWEEKLQSILSNPQAMGQIAALAQSFSRPSPEPGQAQPDAEEGWEPVQPSGTSSGGQPAPGPEQSDATPADMWQPVSQPEGGETGPSHLESDTGDPAQQGPGPLDALGALGDLDPRLLRTALGVLSAYRGEDDRKTALLNALRPYLKPERQGKVDQAIRIARLSRVIRTALQLLREGGQEEDGHV